MARIPFKDEAQQSDEVMLVHGMCAGNRSMQQIGDALADVDYRVSYWGYSSLSRSLEVHGRHLADAIRQRAERDNIRQFHFVGHSMGCIILRIALKKIQLPSCGRIVMLAPPNSGSRLTRLPMGPIASLFPQLPEMSEDADSLVNRLPEPDGIEVGIIAARRDIVVDVDSTHLRSEQDHLVIDTSHQRLPANQEATQQVRHFLMHGHFRRSAAPSMLQAA